ncbi:hypothetical protein LOK49_Contig247G00002 [Camellia lanceoleosa]|nr:hypothetical protein LOK49_Contig247G00002 [Camellia lanceoleosa]
MAQISSSCPKFKLEGSSSFYKILNNLKESGSILLKHLFVFVFIGISECEKNFNVRQWATVSPRYDQYKDAWDTHIKIGDRIETVRFFHCYKRGVDRVFVDHLMFLEKVYLYGGLRDNQIRFSILCQAALEAPRILNLYNNKYFSGPYGEDVVFIANDWHTALLPCYLKTKYKKINWMKGGILESNRVVTVSPYYAQELVSGIDKGVELDNIIRKTGITGIVNGVDVQEWNPSTDKYIDVKYNATIVMATKRLLKEALQVEVGLPVDANIPLIGFIGRLEEQKGSDILAAAISKFIRENVQIVVLGTGKKYMEKQLEQLEIIYPDKAKRVAKFNIPLAHMIIAESDFMLLPSRFEPCGLIQLHAVRYGSINPVFPPVDDKADVEGQVGGDLDKGGAKEAGGMGVRNDDHTDMDEHVRWPNVSVVEETVTNIGKTTYMQIQNESSGSACGGRPVQLESQSG